MSIGIPSVLVLLVKLLSRVSLEEQSYSNLLRLAVHVVLVLGHFHGNPLGLGVRVLGGNDLGVGEGGVSNVLLPQQTPQACPLVIAKRRSS